MKRDRRLLATVCGAVAAAALLLVTWVALIAAMAPLAPDKRDALFDLLGSTSAGSSGGAAGDTRARRCGRAADLPAVGRRSRRACSNKRACWLRVKCNAELDAGDGNADVRGLAQVIDTLVRQRTELRGDIAAKIQEASRNVEQERSRLAALMSELTQSVVVCNLDGRVLLYNNRARAQFRALSQTPTLAAGTELIGLGRSIYTVFDRKLVAHALENIQQRLRRGVANPSAQFVTTTRAGGLLRVQMAPVRSANAEPGQEAVLNGFVLMLDNITSDFEQESARDRLLHGLTEGSRASLGNMQAAVEVLDDPELDASMRERFHRVIHDEVHAMSARIRTLAEQAAQQMKTRWPLEDMLGTDLVAAAQRRIEAAEGLRVGTDQVDDALWLKVDSFSLMQALAYLAGRLAEDYDIKFVRLRLTPADKRAHLDIVWSGQAISTEAVASWETDPIRVGSEVGSLSVRDIVQRHGGEFWFERDRARQQAFFRFLLPLASAQEELELRCLVHGEGRPEYYDFDLFQATEHVARAR